MFYGRSLLGQTDPMKRRDRAAIRQRSQELRAMLVAWDPIGTVATGGPADEYDCVLWPLMRLLNEEASQDKLVEFLSTELRDHFGLEPEPSTAADFAVRAQAWFQMRRKDARQPSPNAP